MSEAKLAVFLVVGMLLGGAIAATAGAISAAMLFDEMANSLLSRAESLQIACGPEYNPKALTLTIDGINTYCIATELKEEDFNAHKPF